MIAIIAKPATLHTIEELNHKGIFTAEPIAATSAGSVQRALEGSGVYSHIFVDINAFKGNIDTAMDLLERLKKTMYGSTLIVYGEALEQDSADYQNILEMGIPDIITSAGASLKKQLLEILLRDGQITGQAIGSSGEEEHIPESENWLTATQPVPPSQVPRIAAKAAMLPKPPPKNIPKGIVIACAGIGSRIGTTTQAVQTALYLKSTGATVAVVQMNKNTSSLEAFIPIMETTLINDLEFEMGGLTIFRNSGAISKAKANYNYVVCDYGDYLALADNTVFLDKDVKIVIAGIKPWESAQLEQIFLVDDGSINYIFTFAPPLDHPAIKEQMLESAEKTFFAPYTPDYFQYCGADELYKSLLGFEPIPRTDTPPKKKPGLLGRLR